MALSSPSAAVCPFVCRFVCRRRNLLIGLLAWGASATLRSGSRDHSVNGVNSVSPNQPVDTTPSARAIGDDKIAVEMIRSPMSVFDRACDVVLGTEGGFTAAPADPGNWTGGRCGVGKCAGTKFGISAAAYPTHDIAGLTVEAARALYARDYWQHIAGDALPPPLALLVFDAAVNSGVVQALRWLQRAVDVSADGAIGPATLGAVNGTVRRSGVVPLCAEYNAQRLYFLSRLPTWPAFGLGWSRRLARLAYQSLTMDT